MFDDRICISVTGSLAGFSTPEALDTARVLGFQSVAVMPDGVPQHSLGMPLPTLLRGTSDSRSRDCVREKLAGFRRISIHQSWDRDWPSWIETAHEVGAEIVTVHAGLPPSAGEARQAFDARLDFLREFGRHAADRGVTVGIENEGGDRDLYVRLVHAVDLPTVGATLDIGHCAFFDRIRGIPNMQRRAVALNCLLAEVIAELGDRLLLLHVHNVRPFEQVDLSSIPRPYWKPGEYVDHRSLDRGDIDVPALFEALGKGDFAGMLEIELEEPEREAEVLATARCIQTQLDRTRSAAGKAL